MQSLRNWVRPAILAMAGYTPGEQPAAGRRMVKLNTNENPEGPPEVVLAALRAALDDTLRLYPEPSARPVREAAARAYQAYGIQPDQVVAGNGSDDLLTMILRTCVEPGALLAVPAPTYTLYASLAQLQGAHYREFPWLPSGDLPLAALAGSGAQVIIIARPNAPTGHAMPLTQVAQLCEAVPGVVVLDEAYADFADDHGLPLLAGHPNLIVTRSFSKSLSLAGLRIGLGFMAAPLAAEFHKVRDSYNLDRLAQAAAVAALDHLAEFQPAVAKIRAERARLTHELGQRGFQVTPSQANFVLAAVPPGSRSGQAWTNALRDEGILVRYFGADPQLAHQLRITVGRPEENDALLAAIDRLLAAA